MFKIVSSLKASPIFSSLEIIELITEESVSLLRVKATVADESVLYVTELHVREFQKYSYHWQKANGELIVRWDNKPHWKEIKTFPHHRHEGNDIFPSQRIDIDDVIQVIEERVKKNQKPSLP